MTDMDDFEIGSGFGFSGQIIDALEAAEYTLVTIALDETGSITGFEREIEEMLKTAIAACAASPYSQNLLIRVIRFGSQYRRSGSPGVDEVHGFTALSEIDVDAYPSLTGGGMTPLYDALYSSVGATNTYARGLQDLDFAVNGITFVITDGAENASVATANMVRDELAASVTGEIMESHHSVLIGIDTGFGGEKDALSALQSAVGLDQFIWAGSASRGTLAKLAKFVSQSISSTSQALGTGGPSTQISPTI